MGRVLSGEGMLRTVLEGRIFGKRGRGRKIIGFLDRMKGSRHSNELKGRESAGMLQKYSR